MARTRTSETPLWNDFKRQSIQQAVIRLMFRDGLQGVTMERVAQETGIAKGTVYLHYKDKQELLEAVKESALAPIVARTDDVVDGGATPPRKLHAWAQRYLTYFDENRNLFRILLYEREVMRVWGRRYQTDRYKHLVDGVERVVREGMKKHEFRDVEPARHVAAMFVEACIATVNQRLLMDKPLPVEDDAALISDLFTRGLARDPEPKRRSSR